MPDTRKQEELNPLVHWSYSREEWRRFNRWAKFQRGLLAYILHRLVPRNTQPVPEVRITHDRVWTGDTFQLFRTPHHKLKKIDIRSERDMNIMEISYEWSAGNQLVNDEIRILIPRGKLREAVRLQDRLQHS